MAMRAGSEVAPSLFERGQESMVSSKPQCCLSVSGSTSRFEARLSPELGPLAKRIHVIDSPCILPICQVGCAQVVSMGAVAEIYYQKSCQSRFSGVHLGFEVLQERNLGKGWQFPTRLQACISVLRCFRQKWRISVFALFE